MILQRKPKAPDLVYDACEAALPHVCRFSSIGSVCSSCRMTVKRDAGAGNHPAGNFCFTANPAQALALLVEE